LSTASLLGCVNSEVFEPDGRPALTSGQW